MKQPYLHTDRRTFLKTGGAVAAGLLAQAASPANAAIPAMPANPP